jgi:hypothetical protein
MFGCGMFHYAAGALALLPASMFQALCSIAKLAIEDCADVSIGGVCAPLVAEV